MKLHLIYSRQWRDNKERKYDLVYFGLFLKTEEPKLKTKCHLQSGKTAWEILPAPGGQDSAPLETKSGHSRRPIPTARFSLCTGRPTRSKDKASRASFFGSLPAFSCPIFPYIYEAVRSERSSGIINCTPSVLAVFCCPFSLHSWVFHLHFLSF